MESVAKDDQKKSDFLTALDSILEKDPDKAFLHILHHIRIEPRSTFHELRENHPNLLTSKGAFVTRFHDVQEVLSHPEVFTVRHYRRSMDPGVGPFMLSRDNTSINQRDKSIMTALLRREDLPKVRAIVKRLAEQAIFNEQENGQLNLINISRKVPAQLTGEYFGFPGPDVETMMRWSRATQHDMFHNYTDDESVHHTNLKACFDMREYLVDHIEKTRSELKDNCRKDDILRRLLKMQLPEIIGFDQDRILANVMGLLVGGVETTSAAIAQIIDELLRRPETLAQAKDAAARDQDDLFSKYLWEALRLFPMNPFVVRITSEDYTVAKGSERELRIPAGAPVFASTASAMNDPHEIDQPDEFKIDRPHYHFMHFGYGPHLCLGVEVSMVQIPEVIKQVLLKKNIRRAPGQKGELDFKGGPFPESFMLEMN